MAIQRGLSCTLVLILLVAPSLGCGGVYNLGGNDASTDASTDAGATRDADAAMPDLCGNGQVDPGENCDGALLNNATCSLSGFSGGNLACSSTCQFDVSACTGATITPTVVASRTGCAAPCGVFFDATTTSGLSGSNYWRANWSWDFNDPTTTHKGAIGFVVGHVFDNPGTYNVVTRVHDLAGNAGSTTTTITVTPMAGTTYYVASSGSDSNSGTDMAHPLLTPLYALGHSYATNNSILFRRGDTFAADAIHAYQFNTAGPFLMGAYTDPASPSFSDPIFTTAVTDDTQFNLFSADLRFQHIHLIATNGMTNWFEVTRNSALIEYVEMEGLGLASSPGTNIHLDSTGPTVTDSFVFDNNLHDFIGYGLYSGADNVAIVGNDVTNFTGGTASPLNGVWLGACTNGLGNCNVNQYLAENTIMVAPTGQIFTAFTIHGDIQNVVVVGNTVDHPCGIGPTDINVVEHPNTALFEGNVFDWPASNVSYVNLVANGANVEVRNNLMVNGDVGVEVGSSYPMLPTNFIDQVFVENNTDYQNPPPGQPTNYGVQFARHAYTTGAATFLNNIFWEGMMIYGSQMVEVDGMGTETIDYNDMYAPNAAMITTPNVGPHGIMANPMFVSRPAYSNANAITPSMFFLQSSSPGVNTGTNTGAYEDFYRVARPQQGAWDMGAFERVP